MTTKYSLKQIHQQRIRALSDPLEPVETFEKPVLKYMPNIKAVVFDFYGTMFISATGDTVVDDPKGEEAEAMAGAFKYIFPDLERPPEPLKSVLLYKQAIHDHKEADKRAGIDYPEVDIIEVWKDVLSRLRETGDTALPEFPDDELIEQLAIEFEMRNNPTWPMPDLEETLEELDARDMLLGILSNSQFYTPLIYEAHLEASPTQSWFDVNLCIWSYEERRCKPSLPFHGSLKQALQAHFDVKPEEVLFVGNDMLKDIYPAHHFGFKTALFAGDARSLKWRREDDRCAAIQPDLVITRLYQLVECLR